MTRFGLTSKTNYYQHLIGTLYLLGKNLKIVETDRLLICEVESWHIDELGTVLSDPDVMKYSIVGVHSRNDIENYIDNCQEQYKEEGYGQ